MIARRIVATLLTLLTLHLNLLGADAACAKHGKGDAHGSMNMTSMVESHIANGATHSAMALPSASDTDDKPCEIPAQSNCCRALVSCSVVFAANAGLSVAATTSVRDEIAAKTLNAPRSEIVSPDPPPPKA